MVGKFTHGSTMSRLMVWLLLIAFSICLLSSTAFSRQRPYDIKTVTHVVKETDDGGWDIPPAMPYRPEVGNTDSSKNKSGRMAIVTFVWRLWTGLFIEPQQPLNQNSVNVSTGSSSSTSTTAE